MTRNFQEILGHIIAICGCAGIGRYAGSYLLAVSCGFIVIGIGQIIISTTKTD